MNYGKHDYVPMETIQTQFAACVADPSMRSVSAVVRIGREQLSARGSLGSYRWNTAFFGTLALVSALAFPFTPDPWGKYLFSAAVVGGGITVVLGIGVALVWKDAKRLVPEDRELKHLILATLEEILAKPPAKLRPPDWTEANFLRKLGAAKGGPALREWLDTSTQV
ncbi:hypothetical protein BH11ARM2_BH11ARM2_37330 [soil metagenome]